MVAYKIRAIWDIIRSRQFIVISERNGEFNPVGAGVGELHDLVGMSIELKRAYNHMVDAANAMATETGELHALEEMRAAIDKLGAK